MGISSFLFTQLFCRVTHFLRKWRIHTWALKRIEGFESIFPFLSLHHTQIFKKLIEKGFLSSVMSIVIKYSICKTLILLAFQY